LRAVIASKPNSRMPAKAISVLCRVWRIRRMFSAKPVW
jgi:hypothetical protein